MWWSEVVMQFHRFEIVNVSRKCRIKSVWKKPFPSFMFIPLITIALCDWLQVGRVTQGGDITCFLWGEYLGGTTTTRIGVTWLYVRNTPYYSEPISASFTNSLICSMSPLPSSPAAVIGQHAHSVAIGCTLCVDKFTPSRSSKHCRDFCTSAPPTVWRHTVTEVKFESKQAVSHT